MPFDVIVVGSASIDHNVKTPRLPAPGETILGDAYYQNCGGKGANQAVAAARLGVRTGMLVRVGRDDAGRTIVQNLRESGVSDALVTVDAQAASGTAHISVSADGQNQIVVVPGANSNLSPADVAQHKAAFTCACVLMLQLEIPLETAVAAARAAREAGVQVILDPAPAQPLPAELYQLADFIVPNEAETEQLTGIAVTDLATAERAARLFRERGVRTPIVKLGAHGALLLDDGGPVHVPGFAVQVVDTTAAGDAFAGGLAAALVEGKPLADAVRFANAVGALACTQYGAMPSMPDRTAVYALYT